MFASKNNTLGNLWRMLLCSFLLLCAHSPPANAQPLRFLLQRVAQTHPAIVSQSELAAASEASVSEAKSGYLPRVGVSAGYGYQERDRTGGLGINGKTDSSPLDANLSISQNLFEGFRTDGTVSSAESSMMAANWRLNSVRQQIFLQAITAYIQLVKQLHLVQLSQQNVMTLQNQVSLEEERMMAGTGIAVDVLLTKSRLQFANERYASYLGALRQSEASFTQLFGMAPDYRTMQLPSISPAVIPRQEAQAVQTALQRNPSLKEAELQTDAAQSERDVARAGYFPRLDVVASSDYQDAADDISGETSTNSIALRGSWELFSGFSDQSKEKRAIHNYQSSLASAEHTQRQVIESTKQAWQDLLTTQQRMAILQNAVQIAEQVYGARLRLRDIGSETAINVLDAENELFSAQINAVSAQYDSYISTFRLLQSMGMLELNSLL